MSPTRTHAPPPRPTKLTHSLSTPLNREPPPASLISTYLTPQPLAYDRNHSALPHLPAATYTLSINGKPYSLSTLQASFPHTTVVAALQCAGNRRATMRRIAAVDGIDWHDGAVCNARWGGVLLADVLRPIILGADAAHVVFACSSVPAQDDGCYAGSIPLDRCLDRDMSVLLAWEMNGEPLGVAHGGPLRVVAPGVAGARWTKWVDRIEVQSAECAGYYQQKDYKILPPHVNTREEAERWWPRVPSIQALPVNSVVCVPQAGEVVRRGETCEVKGYAVPQGDDGPVVMVEVSFDDGGSWERAEIVEGGDRWGWAIWRWEGLGERLRGGKVLSRATDRRGNRQEPGKPWNFRGVAYNAYGEVDGVKVVD